MTSSSIFWYDYETTGINPRCDRPLQVAGIRTDEDLNEIDTPLNLYCRLADDILPHPAACLVTGITPDLLAERGLCEAEFVTRLHAELARPGTCTAGYNSLRFDDEISRYALYRNFFDPYAREWQSGNSRWDLIDLLRTAYALRPEGIHWPQEEGRVTLRLEQLAAANGIDHGQAHDALADVRTTIALARLLRERQPKLYGYLYQLRSKQRVLEQIRLLRPLLHVSGRFAAERGYLAVVLPLAWHPTNRNALIVCDLQADPAPLLDLDAEVLRRRLYTRREEREADELPVPLKLVHINRCPVLAPLSVLRENDIGRLRLNMAECQKRADLLCAAQSLWQEKLSKIYAGDEFPTSEDPEQQLYAGFFGERDRSLCEQVRRTEPQSLGRKDWGFDDARLSELLFRYRARNFPETLTVAEGKCWQEFCQRRLSDAVWGAPNTLEDFNVQLEQMLAQAGGEQLLILAAWREYARQLRECYAV